jgi:hypothetical protein
MSRWGRDIDDLENSKSERSPETLPAEPKNTAKSRIPDSVERSRAGESEPSKQLNERRYEENARQREDPADLQRERILTSVCLQQK